MLIVIADDDPDDISLVIEALHDNQIHAKVIYVKNGQELLDLLLQRGDNRMQGMRPDLIILDINMHVMDGLAALEAIRSEEQLRLLPIYILSTTIRPDYLQKAQSLGIRNYYQKPAEYTSLKAIVKQLCLDVL